MKPTSATPSVSPESHADVLLQGVETLRTSESLFDYTLIAEEEEVPVHKVVMAACSDYFRSMFCGGMKESKQSSVVLHTVTAATLKSLVDFAYSGAMDLSMENVDDLVHGAQYFQMTRAVELCSKFMKEQITLETVVQIRNISVDCSLDSAFMATIDFISKNFEIVSEEVFMTGSEELYFTMLGSNSLNITSEFALFKKLIDFKMMLHEDIFHGALSKVRYPLMTSEELSIVANTEEMSLTRNWYLIEEALDYKSDVLKQPLKQTERTQVRSDKTYSIFTVNNLILLLKTGEEDIFRRFRRFEDQDLSFLQQMAVVDNFLYVCSNKAQGARGTQLNTFLHRYDPRFNAWHRLPSMNVKTAAFPFIPNQGHIYAVGGQGGRTVESYSIEENRWHTRASLTYDNVQSSGVAYNNKIYISGGSERDSPTSYANLSCYDPTTDTWELKAPMIKARVYHQMAVVSDKLYVFGGGQDLTVEYYIPEVDQWTLTGIQLNGIVEGIVVDCKEVTIGRNKRDTDGTFLGIILEKYDTDTEQVTNTVEKDFPDFGEHIQQVLMMNACLTMPMQRCR